MDACLADWHTEDDIDFSQPFQRKHLGLDNELMEILWQNGEAVLHSQSNKKPASDSSCEFNHHDEEDDEEEQQVSWISSPANESFHEDFCADLLSDQFSLKSDADKLLKFPSTEALNPHLIPPQTFEPFGAAISSPVDLQFSYKDRQLGKSSVMTKELSNGSTDQAVNEVNTSPDSKPVGTPENGSCEGSGSGKASSLSSDNTRNKRKIRAVEESEYPSDATELESPDGNNRSSQKLSRRRRVAEVHNQSERRRRDRINEKMQALQALIPHSHKSDKASVLDEAIEYMKSLQLQLQWWMGTGMAQSMHPMMPQQYIYNAGIGIRPPMFPSIQNMMCLPNQAMAAPMGHNFMFGHHMYQNQMQNASIHSVLNAAQAVYSSHPAPENLHPNNVKSKVTNSKKG